MLFCNDHDLLHWEPNLATEAAAVAEILFESAATLRGNVLTFSGAVLALARTDTAIELHGGVGGCFAVGSIESPRRCTLVAIPGTSSESELRRDEPRVVRVRAMSFESHRAIVSRLITSAAEVAPRAAICDVSSLRRVCVLGTLQGIYASLAATFADDANLEVRRELYTRLYRRAFRNTAIELDCNGDGQPDLRRMLRQSLPRCA